MNNYVRRWGSSAAVRIPAAMLEAAGLKVGDCVAVRGETGRIVVKASPHRMRSRSNG